MHPQVESYLVINSLAEGKTIQTNKKGKEYVASKIDSIYLSKKHVVICDDWFLLHVHNRFLKKVISLLVKTGIDRKDISHFDTGITSKLYVTQDPNKFIPCLMEFEKLVTKKEG